MPTHAYCLLNNRDPAPRALVGLDDAPVRAIVSEDTSMWVSDAPALPSKVTVERVQRHDAVVNVALETGTTPLPMRYGQRFDSDDDALRYLTEHRAELRPLFARVDGMIEMSVIVAPVLKKMLLELEPVRPSALDASRRGAGLGYLEHVRQRAAREERARSDVELQLERVSAAVRSLARAEERQARGRGMGVIAHLVALADASAYREAVLAMHAAKDWQLVVSGPRAPYSFCAVGGGEPGGTFLAT